MGHHTRHFIVPGRGLRLITPPTRPKNGRVQELDGNTMHRVVVRSTAGASTADPVPSRRWAYGNVWYHTLRWPVHRRPCPFQEIYVGHHERVTSWSLVGASASATLTSGRRTHPRPGQWHCTPCRRKGPVPGLPCYHCLVKDVDVWHQTLRHPGSGGGHCVPRHHIGQGRGIRVRRCRSCPAQEIDVQHSAPAHPIQEVDGGSVCQAMVWGTT